MVKTTINIPDKLWRSFTATVIKKHGGRKVNKVITGLIKRYMKENETVTR